MGKSGSDLQSLNARGLDGRGLPNSTAIRCLKKDAKLYGQICYSVAPSQLATLSSACRFNDRAHIAPFFSFERLKLFVFTDQIGKAKGIPIAH
jgi:hypothetical protein